MALVAILEAMMAYPRTPAVGMDLGTTFSAVAHLDVWGRPQTLNNAEGEKLTPSVALLDDDGAIVVGKEAVQALEGQADRVAECAKRELGRRYYPKRLGGREYPPEVIQASILRKLAADSQRQIGQYHQVVITVPAYFDEVRRKATQDAGYMAGMEVLDIVNEPTAAALAFGFQQGYMNQGRGTAVRQTILVYDLGGGTFDVTVMDIEGDQYAALATDGDVRLGGRDWDQRLVDHVAERLDERWGVDPRSDPNTLAALWRECEEAKRRLSARAETKVACRHQGRRLAVDITREVFEELTRDLLERTAFTTRQTLQAAGLQWADIDRLLLVGGSTRMPAVAEMLTRLSGKELDRSVSPDEAVAQGAALRAGVLLAQFQGRPPRFRIRNVNSHSLGVAATDAKTRRPRTAVLIPRNTPLPATAKRVFRTQKEGQRSILVQIVEGESAAPEACSQIGKCSVRDLPADLQAGAPIEVRFSYKENGRLTVRVRVEGTERRLKHVIRRQNSLPQQQLDLWRRRISGPFPESEAAPP